MYNNVNENAIAIIGMAADLPGAEDVHSFWSNICAGVESAGKFPSQRENELLTYVKAKGKETCKYKTGSYLNDISSFDHNFFKIPKKEAIAMLPAQRLFLQSVETALEDAGYGGDKWYGKNIGVYVGYIGNMEMVSYQHILEDLNFPISPNGTLSSNIAGRISYYMNFSGESVLVDSACSSSLAALKYACAAIQNEECEAAIVGGVQVDVFPNDTGFSIGIESPDGHTRPFDKEANGTGQGEGVATIIIKRLKNAVEDRDNIYGIINSIICNQDGHSLGLSAPNPRAQMELIKKSVCETGVDLNDISYLELHGTGTKIGDPIELNAIAGALQSISKSKSVKPHIGSVKANIGHTFACSGLVGIIKCCLMLTHKKICPQINFNSMNTLVNTGNTNFIIDKQLTEWTGVNKRVVCGVSNFGFSGTNYHIIISNYSKNCTNEGEENKEIYVLSAMTEDSLKESVKKQLYYLMENKNLSLADVCYTMSTGRGHYLYRLAIICQTIDELIDCLKNFNFCSNEEMNMYYAGVKKVADRRKQARFGEISADGFLRLKKEIEELLNNIDECGWDIIATKLCSCYIGGGKVHWDKLYKTRNVNKISLPTYSFEKVKCWP